MDKLLGLLEKLFNGTGKLVKLVVYTFIIVFVGTMIYTVSIVSDETNKETERVEKKKEEISQEIMDRNTAGNQKSAENLDKPKIERPNIIITVPKIFHPKRYMGEEYVVIEQVITNNTSQTISGIKGTLKSYDMFGEQLKDFEVNETKDLAPGQSRDIGGEYFSGMDNTLQKMADTDINKMKFEFVPSLIIYADGTKWEE